ncbi:mechanosensitive ion channel family protein [Pseudomonas kitaguniensis]|uniref:mechanosensitive ion channel family protein n=1 Tax=Pseudomonas kitaguniensis TaxID=2607908 RepID=UPI003D026CBF
METQYKRLLTDTTTWVPVVLEYGAHFLLAIATLVIGWWMISGVTRRISKVLARRHVDPTLRSFTGSLVNMGLKITLIISVASMIGIHTTSFIALVGTAGLAVGLALQGSLSNLAGGVLILLFRPFKVGDVIETPNLFGTVNSIRIFHTIILTIENKKIVVPNGVLSNGVITNLSSEPVRRVTLDVGVDYACNLATARAALLGMAVDPRIEQHPEPTVVVKALGDSAIVMSLRVWAKPEHYWHLLYLLNERAPAALAKEGISIPFPQRVITVINTQ